LYLSAICSISPNTPVSPAWCSDLHQHPILAPQISISQPSFGFGTWNLDLSPENTTEAVSFAIQTGYRQIDCAAAYNNEKAVGKGIADGLKKANLTREQIWVTSKLWNDHHGDPEVVEAGLKQTLEDLGVGYLDLYLMHWPVVSNSKKNQNELEFVQTWKSMIALPKDKVLNIGVSNFSPAQLKTLISKTTVKPFVHQMELHPYLQQSTWIAAHETLGISVTAYSPLGNSNPTYGDKDYPPALLKNDVILEIAGDTDCTPAQVALAWGLSRGTAVIPKSSHTAHIEENFGAQQCELGVNALAKLKLLGSKFLTRFNNPSEKWDVELFGGLDGV